MTHQATARAEASYAADDIRTNLEVTATPARSPVRRISAPLAEFGAHTASFTSQLIGADWSCFYYPTNLILQNLRFVSVFDRRLSCAMESRRNYWNFLSAFGTRDAAEMIFHVGGRAVAGMSLLWVGRARTRADRQLGESLQSYIELNLAAHYGPLPLDLFPEAGTGLTLTDRELEIARLVCHGSTNAQIAQRLDIGVSTVKTHLLHVFEKLGVRTRAALVSRCFSALMVAGPASTGPRGVSRSMDTA